MEVETEPQETEMDAALENAPEESGHQEVEPQDSQQEEQKVPLASHIKERKKRQEAESRERDADRRAARMEGELQAIKDSLLQREEEPDESLYESATRADLQNNDKSTDQKLNQTKEEMFREIEERIWKSSNTEKTKFVDENIEQFLNERPNLKGAIKDSPNRYSEAYTLMTALTPRKAEMKERQKVEAPPNPSSVSKSAGVNEVLDFSKMSDMEYKEWRNSKIVRR